MFERLGDWKQSVFSVGWQYFTQRFLFKALKDSSSLSSCNLFHIRSSAHILNLLVQDYIGSIKDIIYNVQESVKYINNNDVRLDAFCYIMDEQHLKEKFIIDCPTRWNSTYKMLHTVFKFKTVFPHYKERES